MLNALAGETTVSDLSLPARSSPMFGVTPAPALLGMTGFLCGAVGLALGFIAGKSGVL